MRNQAFPPKALPAAGWLLHPSHLHAAGGLDCLRLGSARPEASWLPGPKHRSRSVAREDTNLGHGWKSPKTLTQNPAPTPSLILARSGDAWLF